MKFRYTIPLLIAVAAMAAYLSSDNDARSCYYLRHAAHPTYQLLYQCILSK